MNYRQVIHWLNEYGISTFDYRVSGVRFILTVDGTEKMYFGRERFEQALRREVIKMEVNQIIDEAEGDLTSNDFWKDVVECAKFAVKEAVRDD